jgi:hypothetical protein
MDKFLFKIASGSTNRSRGGLSSNLKRRIKQPLAARAGGGGEMQLDTSPDMQLDASPGATVSDT